jgi:hypothetical protein
MSALNSFYLYVLLFLTCSHANIVHFNQTASYLCNPSCQFNDSSIWNQGAVPDNGDQVFINVENLGYNIQIYITYLYLSLHIYLSPSTIFMLEFTN